MTEADVSDCLENVRQGDEAASRTLIQYMYPTIYRLVRSHASNSGSEEDLVQIVLIKIFKSLDQFSAKVPFKHWVSRVTVNTCLNAIRHEKRRPEVRMADLSEDEEAVVLALAATAAELSPDAQLCARDLIQRLVACLKTEERFLIRLIYLEGFTIEEASQITSWGVGAVSMRLSRARAKMRERYESLFNEIKSKHESI